MTADGHRPLLQAVQSVGTDGEINVARRTGAKQVADRAANDVAGLVSAAEPLVEGREQVAG